MVLLLPIKIELHLPKWLPIFLHPRLPLSALSSCSREAFGKHCPTETWWAPLCRCEVRRKRSSMFTRLVLTKGALKNIAIRRDENPAAESLVGKRLLFHSSCFVLPLI